MRTTIGTILSFATLALCGTAVAGTDKTLVSWVALANNASFGALAAYDELVPGFEALFERQGLEAKDPWPGFYDAVKRLAALPKAERHAALQIP